jgi:6-phosphogluconolactonase
MAAPVGADVRVFPDLGTLVEAAAHELADLAREAAAERRRFAIALSGGSTPRTLYDTLAARFREEIPWRAVHLFWGDERFVAVESQESNFHLAFEHLISCIRIPEPNIHPVMCDMEDPRTAAATYEGMLREFFEAEAQQSEPLFDLVLLGVGRDGHTASLFPGDPVLAERERWVRAVEAPEGVMPRQRVTLTPAAVNASRRVFFLAAGSSKREVVREILAHPEEAAKRYPAALIRPRGNITWFLDREVAGSG